jgi:translation initiation factor IF-1
MSSNNHNNPTNADNSPGNARPGGGGGRGRSGGRGGRSGGGPGGFRRGPIAKPAGRGKHGDVAEKEESVELEGTVSSVLAGTMFRVTLNNESQHVVLAHISGKMRKRFIRLVVGDRVKIEMSPYDTDKARIVYRC